MFGLDFDPITGEKYKTDAEMIRSALTSAKKRKIMDAVGNKCEKRGCRNKAYVIHHIKQVKNRGTNVGTNVCSNLIVLCANCHSDVHSGAITQTKLKGFVKNRSEKRKKEINKILRNRKKVGTEKSQSSTSQYSVGMPSINLPSFSPFETNSKKKGRKKKKDGDLWGF